MESVIASANKFPALTGNSLRKLAIPESVDKIILKIAGGVDNYSLPTYYNINVLLLIQDEIVLKQRTEVAVSVIYYLQE
tara:strand:+ start:74 stop:310 length:237 start_codon:yes stop_codon:yes gene_type:complete